MTIANVALTDTFDFWRQRTNDAINVANQFTDGNATMAGTLTINGTGTALNVANAALVGGQLTINASGVGLVVANSANVGATLNVKGSGTALVVSNSASIGANLTVTGNATITAVLYANASANGLAVANSANIGGSLYITGSANVGANINLTGTMDLGATLVSTGNVKHKRGNTTAHGTYTGPLAELTVDTTKNTAVIHDGVTAGGFALAREDLNNVSGATVTGKVTAGTTGAAGKVQLYDGTDSTNTALAATANAVNAALSTAETFAANANNITAGTLDVARIAAGSLVYAKIQNVSSTDRLLGRSTAGAGTIEEITCTSAGRDLLDDANASVQRTTLGLGTVATLDTGTGDSQIPNGSQSRKSFTSIQGIASNTTVANTAFSGYTYIYSGAGGHTVTLPTRANTVNGTICSIVNKGSGVLSVTRASTDTFNFGSSSGLTTIKIKSGDTIEIVADSSAAGVWAISGGKTRDYDGIYGHLENPAVKTYYIVHSAAKPGTIRQLLGKVTTNNTILQVRVNNTGNVTWGASGNSITFSTTGNTFTANANHTFSPGDEITMVVSSSTANNDFRYSLVLDYDF